VPLSLPLSISEPARLPGPSSLGILKPGEKTVLWSKRQSRRSVTSVCVLGIAGKARGDHEQPKLHFSNLYIFCYHFCTTAAEISALYSLTVIFNLSNTRFPGEDVCFSLFHQPAPPKQHTTVLGKEPAQPTGAEHPRPPLKHRILLAKSCGIQPNGEQMCEGLTVIWDEALAGAWVPGAQPLPEHRAAQPSAPARRGSRSWELGERRGWPCPAHAAPLGARSGNRPPRYCFRSGRLPLRLPIFTKRKQGLIARCWERRMQMA